MISDGMDLNEEKSTRIPLNVLEDMKNHGAEVEKLEGEDLYSVSNIAYKDKAWEIYERWGNSVEGDLRVCTGFFPSEKIFERDLCPDYAIVGLILREANSIVHHYAPLTEEQFQNNALLEIRPPLLAPRAIIRVHHASIALSKLMERIRNSPDNYPTLTSIPSGVYMCTVIQQWPNVGVDIDLFKP